MNLVFSVVFLLTILVASLVLGRPFEVEAMDGNTSSYGNTMTSGNTPIPSTPIPSTPIPSTPIPSTPIPSTPIPSTPIPSTPIANFNTPSDIYGNSLITDVKTSINNFYQGNASNSWIDLNKVRTMVKMPGFYQNESANTKAAVASILPKVIQDEKILAKNEYWKDMTNNVNSLYSTLKYSNY